ncbi:YobI family P-loop NTPase [Methanimicrococcus blatticola]|uniref:YobI-like P-loop NTPase domain-containing protein n=1 Tax=Methanimicrococcus blatticola TaxID=91560 RepID=A0A484F5K2_9EURY|nr:hypothetical protein [Methanimicrococcus blatticola]MBZ3935809.1 hypothetical protein [Methanimicrococcus blatticola]MCC2508071.1 hypothetical protein [Methanimicrococcus blatticola]TDQ68849.1 hypothetical protein C7391_1047 [Methanimicrococcus blatticola]
MSKRKFIFQKLTPIECDNISGYSEALDFVFANDDLKNIAITGPYSSGKTSVFETYSKMMSNSDINEPRSFMEKLKSKFFKKTHKRFLSVSLAEFDNVNSEFKHSPIEVNELEGKIINQLLHQIDSKSVYLSGFKIRNDNFSFKHLVLCSFLLVSFILSSLYLLSFFKLSSNPDSFIFNFLIKDWVFGLILILFLIDLFLIVYYFLRLQNEKAILKSIKIQEHEISLFDSENDMYFDKYLDEILYLIKRSNADFIVFEDLDRFHNNLIFVKLREINQLLNKKDDRVVRFFYLLQDSMFLSKEKTKFFDFIIPIVPIIDNSNSYNYLIAKLSDNNLLESFDISFLQKISLYVDDMRILNNVLNEFLIYDSRIRSSDQDINKLFSLVFFKNLFSQDFSDLQLNRGYVFSVLNQKEDLISFVLDNIDVHIKDNQKLIQEMENEFLNDVIELDTLYLNINPPSSQSSQYSTRLEFVKKINSDEALQKQYASEFEKIKSNPEYISRRVILEKKSNNGINKLKEENSKLNLDKEKMKTKNLSELVNEGYGQINFNFGYESIENDPYFPLIRYLIWNGYIDETYHDYISYFSEPTNPDLDDFVLFREDKIFLRSVLDHKPLDFTFSLKNVNSIVQSLNDIDFGVEAILNFNLLSYLLENNSAYLTNFIHYLEKERRYDFIWDFIQHKKTNNHENITIFINALNEKWTTLIFDYTGDVSNFNMKEYLLISFSISSINTIIDMNKNACINDFVISDPFFLEIEVPDVDNLLNVFTNLNIKFDQVDASLFNSELFDSIYSRSMYVLNTHMIFLIIEHKYNSHLSPSFESLYTLILSEPEQPLNTYISKNMNIFMNLILSNSSVFLDGQNEAVQILNSRISIDIKLDYAEKLKTQLSDLISINSDVWIFLIQNDKISFSLKNIFVYFNKFRYSEDLINFINRNTTQIIDNLDSKNDDLTIFFNETVICDSLLYDKYLMILNSIGLSISDMPSVLSKSISNDKVEFLINSHKIVMNAINLQQIRTKYPSFKNAFIMNDISNYVKICTESKNLLNQVELLDLLKLVKNKTDIKKLVDLSSGPITISNINYSDYAILCILKSKFNSSDLNTLHAKYDTSSKELKDEIVSIYVQEINYVIQNKLALPFDMLIEIFSSPILNTESKNNLFIAELNHFKEQQQITSIFDILQLHEFNEIFISPIQCSNTDFNTQILTNFKNRSWIKFELLPDGNYKVSPINS